MLPERPSRPGGREGRCDPTLLETWGLYPSERSRTISQPQFNRIPDWPHAHARKAHVYSQPKGVSFPS
ncbi:hypothetical protein GCM10011314_21930 [Knoellia flava]|uniref:Uncharacterized protein n=1 Tax=Knoellia flava TaxID=913969 RepID=A0A8H9FU67_9MICO|nr:hypothetical protein GCM10011314_21930 [Knoellia flava]